MRFALNRLSLSRRYPFALLGATLLMLGGPLYSPQIHAQGKSISADGVAWAVRGAWRVQGSPTPIAAGDAIAPGSLLQPTAENSPHSITVLLPDGQSILYECFTAKDCARGFRVPALFPGTASFSVEMVARIRAGLQHSQRQNLATDPQIARDEAVATLGSGNRIQIGGLAAKLPDGSYLGNLKSFDGAHPDQAHVPLDKSGRSLSLTLPAPGLYLLTVTDQRNWPRIQVMLAAVSAQDKTTASDFQKARALFKQWKQEYFGWPAHDFLRAYLESLVLHIPPATGPRPLSASSAPQAAGFAAEPTFSPLPGLDHRNIAIAIHSATPGAVIHFSEDTSQPTDSSPVYRAPIAMTDLPLTIKAFACAPGKKDSPVVTANFRPGPDN